VVVVDGVADLVEEHVQPLLARGQVGQHPDVAAPVDVQAEGVLVLARARVQVGAVQQVPGLQAHAVVGGAEAPVELGLDGQERLAGGRLDLLEGPVQPGLVDVAGGQGEGEPVAVAAAPGDPVAQLDQGEHVVGDHGPDLLAGLPGGPPLVRVAGVGQDPLELVVGDLAVPDAAADGREGVLDPGLEGDQLGPVGLGIWLASSSSRACARARRVRPSPGPAAPSARASVTSANSPGSARARSQAASARCLAAEVSGPASVDAAQKAWCRSRSSGARRSVSRRRTASGSGMALL
jgi:hypothetical protein